jgi:hypothetical protein
MGVIVRGMSEYPNATDGAARLDAGIAEVLRELSPQDHLARDEYRPVFAELQVLPLGGRTAVDVTLSLAGRVVTSRAEGPAEERAVARSAAEAVLDALEEFLSRGADLELAWFKVLEPEGHFGHLVVHSAVSCRTRRGRDLYVGSALSRGDLSVAAVRSALDAMNRPFARFLAGELELGA